MNILLALLVFLVSLPLTVIASAAVLGLRDSDKHGRALVRITTCLVGFMIILLVSGQHYLPAMLAAVGAVWTLHLLCYWGLRLWLYRQAR